MTLPMTIRLSRSVSGTLPGALFRARAVLAWRVHCRWSKMTGAVAVCPARPVSIR